MKELQQLTQDKQEITAELPIKKQTT